MEKHIGFQLDSQTGYFKNNGVDVMAFMDIYPVGHQAGVSMIMHGKRIATNGDVLSGIFKTESYPVWRGDTASQIWKTDWYC